ncbi:MAG: AMP-binding protein [Acidobacteriota bacterium]|nr:AMP-binding protein [Acidobacteriota bacterium]
MTSPGKVDPEELQKWAAKGMGLAYHASLAPERRAVVSKFGDRTWGGLNENANRLSRRLRNAGVGPGDAVALLSRNRSEFIETLQAVARSGGRMTPINWHLTPEEVAYIVDNCEAKVLIADVAFAESATMAAAASPGLKLGLVVGGEIEGFEDYADSLAGLDGSDIEDPQLGTSMLYTSGTTGRPKGVFRKPDPNPPPLLLKCRAAAACNPESDMALVTGPLYHAAPLGLNLAIPFGVGVGAILMDRWDAEETLRLIDEHRATHTHMVATMFHRLLGLPNEIKQRYDTSSMRWLVHGAAPCPVHIKKAMIEWMGPVLIEYYAATEGGSYYVDSDEWLAKPGTVGRPLPGTKAQVQGDDGTVVGPGETGTIYFKAPDNRFAYFKAPDKTASAYRGDYFTMGDMGYVDEDGYLFLTGRSAETIIAGGVNIYPQEIDDVISQHPAVHEVCTVGMPHDEWGESVVTVVEIKEGIEASDELAEEMLAWAREHLPDYKRPRRIDFATDLPRLPTGKILRRQVREPYWVGRDKQI